MMVDGLETDMLLHQVSGPTTHNKLYQTMACP